MKNYNLKYVIKGDQKIPQISAASIVAKESHDKHIRELCNENPELNEKYDLLNNMGYGNTTLICLLNTQSI